jgi:hypothetical protein
MGRMRGWSPTRPALVVALLVVTSTGLRLTASQGFTVPWIAPDEMLYGLLGESLWTSGALEIRGAASPFYSLLTPALVGAALTGRGLADGVEIAQLLQTVAMSTTVIPTYLWARRVATPWWAVAAATITVAGPVLVYGGLLMTEPLFYAACTWALFALAAALERPTVARQGVFLLAVTVAAAVRMQALVLLPAFALAACLFALQRPRMGRLVPLAPLAGGIALSCAVLVLVRLAAPGWLGSDDLLGAYATLGETTELGDGVVAMVAWHLGTVVLVSAALPAVATALLAAEGFRRRLGSPTTEAFVATVVAFVPILALQVGLFAAGRLDHVSQRYLVTALPPLAVGLAAWAGAGAPRSRRAVAAIGTVAVALVVVVPISRLVPTEALHDALSTAALARADGHDLMLHAALGAAVAGATALLALLPGRMLWIAPAVVVLVLVSTSIEATRTVRALSAREQADALGDANPRWLDEAGLEDVSLLVTGDRPWEAVARTIFWNLAVTEVLRLPGISGGVPPAPAIVSLDERSGLLLDAAGRPLERPLVAAPASFQLVGERVAELPVGSSSSPPTVVTRTDGAVRVSAVVAGVLPNGDFGGEVSVLVPACAPGALELTVIGKSGDPIDAYVNGVLATQIAAAPGETPTAAIPAPAYADGTRPCSFVLFTEGFVGTTRIAYVPSA